MLFNSYIFILYFLPACLVGYFVLNRFRQYKIGKIWMIAMSLLFYGYFNVRYLPIICFSILINYFISYGLNRMETSGKKKALLVFGVVLNIAVIFYFKYFDFFLENINALLHMHFELKNIVLPLGISFFTFQQVSFLVDSYRGETGAYNFIDYALFVVFFPQLVAGPIVLHKEMIPQFSDESKKHFNADNFARGLYMFAVGLFKKVLLADTLAKAVTWGYDVVWDLTSMEVLLVSLAYTFQLYLDFSGYCDMAVGIGAMFNIDIPVNFNSPYKSLSIMEFWDRWHITLNRFLREYVYIPLGGNRKGKVRTYVNVMIVFLVSGLWHGANWTFIIWGFMHGVANCLNRLFKKGWEKIWKGIRWALTFIFVNCAWIMFRADTAQKGWRFIRLLFTMESLTVREELWESIYPLELNFMQHKLPYFWMLSVWIPHFEFFFVLAVSAIIIFLMPNCHEKPFKPTVFNAILTVVLLTWSIISLSGVSTFLYFNF